jgi:hypothetical protein
MKPRPILFALLGGLVATGAGFVACSSGGSASSGFDAGFDTGTADTGITVFDTGAGDGGSGLPDTSFSRDGGAGDSGKRDALGAVDGHATDAPITHCSLVTGACDIVAQNCSSGTECDIVSEPDGSLGTACEAVTSSEHLAKGAPCCPPSDGTNPCDPGLECNGGNPCAAGGTPMNAGWGGSRCTPRCCPALDGGNNNANCGTAGDGGAQGQCDLSISFVTNGPGEYTVCSYPATCEPLGIHPCMSGFGCEVENAAGTSQCVVTFDPTGDGGAGQPCMYENSCADGLGCFGASASTSTCEWLCAITGGTPPFDAGLLNTMPGHGGCPTGQSCEGVNGFPTWLGVCGT